MAVNLVTVTGNLETLIGANPTSAVLWFKLNRPEWNADGDIFAPEHVQVTPDNASAFTVALQSTAPLLNGAYYTAIIRYRDDATGLQKEYTLGSFTLPTGGPFQLGDMLATYPASSFNPNNNFTTRAAFIAALPTLSHIQDGQTVFAGGYPFVRLAASTAIADAPGWVPGQFGDVIAAPSVLPYPIQPSMSGRAEDASRNVAATNAALAESAATGRDVVFPRGTYPINGQIVPPTNGGFSAYAMGTTFLVRANNTGGFFRSAAPATRLNNVIIDGWTFEYDMDPGTGNPYIGNGFFALFSNSQLHGLRVMNYWGDQAFLIGGENTDLWYPEFFTNDVQGGSGGMRNVGGDRFITYGAKGVSGDDAIQVVPVESGTSPFFDLGAKNIQYIGGNVMSRSARAFIAYNGPGLVGPITDCGFTDISARVGPQYAAANAANSALFFSSSPTAPVANCFARNCHIDETARRGTSTGNAGGFALQGNVNDGDFDVTISAPDRRVFSCDATAGLSPSRNRVIVSSDAAPAITSIIAVSQSAGVANQITPRIVAPTAQQAVSISGGDRTRLMNGNIRGIQAGQIGIRITSAPTNTTIMGNTMQGSGTSISFQNPALASDHVAINDLGGMAMVQIGAATQTSNRA